MKQRGRPVADPFAPMTRTTITHHVILTNNSAPSRTQHVVKPTAQTHPPDSSDVSHPSHLPEPPLSETERVDQEVYDPSNPNHHLVGGQPGTSGNKRYAAAVSPIRVHLDIPTHSSWQDAPLLEWTHVCDEFLDALIRYDGRGDSLQVLGCPGCKVPGISGTYRCNECFDHEMVCHECCVQRHQQLPLHHIRVSLSHIYPRSSC
jgi:hypothetical protein